MQIFKKTIGETFKDQQVWQRKCLINIAHAGYFSSDRTIKEYADQIWGINPFIKK